VAHSLTAFKNTFLVLLLASFSINAQDSPNVNSDIDDVRIFTGYTVSKDGNMVTPSVVTLIRKGDLLDCRFIAFVGVPLEFRDTVLIPKDGSNPTFKGQEPIHGTGETNDPRGFMVQWNATLDGNIIKGRFTQPYDRGHFTLNEAYENVH
jgi:hypothetical protein